MKADCTHLLEAGLSGYRIEDAEQEALKCCLAEHGLQDLVAPRLPLDLTPMAGERAFLDFGSLLARSSADTLMVGLVPFTQYLETVDDARMMAFAEGLKSITAKSGKRLGVVVDGGTEFEAFRLALMKTGLPLFHAWTMEAVQKARTASIVQA